MTRIKGVLFLCAFLFSACSSGDNELVTNRGEDKDNWWDALPRAAWSAFAKVEQSQDWFEVYEVATGVFAIYEPGQFEEVISYLILGDNQALLFDTGLGIGDMSQVVSELTQLPVVVINSHSHYDHIGGNHDFGNLLGRDTAYTQRRTQGLPHGEVAEFVGPGWIWKDVPSSFSPDAYSVKPFQFQRMLEDGETIDLGNREIQVIFTPGHAPDALCLLDSQNRLLFTGDTFYLAPLYTHLEGSDFDQYVQTAKRLAGLTDRVDYLMPAHNEPKVTKDYLTRLDEAFTAIANGEAQAISTDGNQEYQFEGFSVITK